MGPKLELQVLQYKVQNSSPSQSQQKDYLLHGTEHEDSMLYYTGVVLTLKYWSTMYWDYSNL